MSVTHIGAETDIGDDQQGRDVLLDRLHRLLDDPVARVRPAGLLILLRRDAKQQDGRHTLFRERSSLDDEAIHGELELTRQ
jgi:hypothetical protein